MMKPRARTFKPRLKLEQTHFDALIKLVRAHLAKVNPDQLLLQGGTPIAMIANDPAFHGAAETLARRMLTNLSVENAQSWRAAANRSTKARQIHAALQEELAGKTGLRVVGLVRENTAKIVTVTQDIAHHVTPIIARYQQAGVRSDDIIPKITGHLHQLADWQVKRIARTQVAMSETDLTRARAERIGVRWYEWATSHDQRVRDSHRHMDTVLVRWDDPPSPEVLAGEPPNKRFPRYHAGQTYNCRCVALPLISLDEISWPHKAHVNGRIQRMTRAQFAAIQG